MQAHNVLCISAAQFRLLSVYDSKRCARCWTCLATPEVACVLSRMLHLVTVALVLAAVMQQAAAQSTGTSFFGWATPYGGHTVGTRPPLYCYIKYLAASALRCSVVVHAAVCASSNFVNCDATTCKA